MERKVFFCDCHEPTHQLILEKERWEYGSKSRTELTVFYNLKHFNSFWKRLRNAFNYVFKRDVARVDYLDIVIADKKTLREMRDFLNEIVEETENNS